MRRFKRASILIAAAVAILVGGFSAVILQTANASIVLSKDSKDNVVELYNMEAVHALLLDSAIKEMMSADVSVSIVNGTPDLEEALAALQMQFAGGEILDMPAYLDFVAEDLGLTDAAQKKLAKSIGVNTQERIVAYLSDSLQVSDDTVTIDAEAEKTKVQIDAFELSVELETRRAMVSKVWLVEDVYLVIDNESELASLSFSRASFSPIEAEFK